MRDATGQRAQAFQSLRPQKLLFEFLLLGNIRRDCQEAIDRARTVPQWSGRDEQIDCPSVTTRAAHLVVCKCFTAQRTLVEDVGFLARFVSDKRYFGAENL